MEAMSNCCCHISTCQGDACIRSQTGSYESTLLWLLLKPCLPCAHCWYHRYPSHHCPPHNSEAHHNACIGASCMLLCIGCAPLMHKALPPIVAVATSSCHCTASQLCTPAADIMLRYHVAISCCMLRDAAQACGLLHACASLGSRHSMGHHRAGMHVTETTAGPACMR